MSKTALPSVAELAPTCPSETLAAGTRDPVADLPLAADAPPASAEHLRNFLVGSAFSAAGLACAGVLTMVSGVIFARWLTPEGFGIYSLVLVVVGFAGGFGTGGMDSATNRFICYYLGTGENSLIRTVITYGLRSSLLLSTIVGLALFVLLRSGVLTGSKLAVLAPMSPYVALAIPVFALQLVLLQTILGLQAVKTRIVLEKILHPLLRLVLPFALFWWFRDNIVAAVASVLFSALLICIGSAVVVRESVANLPPAALAPAGETKKWSGYAIPFVFFSLQSFVSQGMGIDILLVSALASVADSGIYAAVFRFTPVLVLARAAMDYAFGPRVGVLYGQSDLKAIGKLYKTSSTLGMTWTLPFSIVLAVFAQPLMLKFFGPHYAKGAMALAILVVGFAADGAVGCNTTLLSMIGKPWLVLLNGLSGGVLTVFLCALLIPHHGMTGAALAVTVSRVVASAMATLEIWCLQRIHPFGNTTLKTVLAAAAAAALALACRHQVDSTGASILMLGVSIGIVLAAYFAVLRLTRLQWSMQ